jgi:hypothetical protein
LRLEENWLEPRSRLVNKKKIKKKRVRSYVEAEDDFEGMYLRLINECICFSGKKAKQKQMFSVKDRTVTVYTSANSTDLRLTKTNTNLQFKDLKQPLETQVCVFVNPAKTFQTYLGIGGAITDASATVFC